MVGGLWFLFALGATGLHVETDTPDALCPPLEPVRQAVRSRLGVVGGGPYEARFAVVRGGDRDADVLLLTLRDANGTELLRRELPLASLGCTDAAEVIALVLERFFQQMSGVDEPTLLPEEAPPSSDAPEEPTGRESVGPGSSGHEPAGRHPAGHEPPAERPEPLHEPDPPPAPDALPLHPSRAPGCADHRAPASSSWTLRGTTTVHAPLAPGAGLGVGIPGGSWIQLVLDATWPLAARSVDEQGLRLATQSSWLFASGLFLLERNRWSFGAGPLVGLELEQAEIEGAPELSAGRKARLLAGVGAHAVALLVLSQSLQLELGLRALPRFTGNTRRFVVQGASDEEFEVLRPAPLAWAGSLGLIVHLGGNP